MFLVKPVTSFLRIFIRSSRYDIFLINSLVLLGIYIYFVKVFYFLTFCNGIALASLAEYLYHRYVLHFATEGTLYFYIHGHHHLKPHNNSIHLPILYLNINHGLTIVLASFYYTQAHIFSAMIGAIVLYMISEHIHKEIHKPHWLIGDHHTFRMFHMYHHMRNKKYCYGFTVPTWDILFGTFPSDILCYNPLALIPVPYFSFYFGLHDIKEDDI